MSQIQMKQFTLPPLPYKRNALEPYISQAALDLHYGKHHQGYVDKLNALVAETEWGLPLEEVMKQTAGACGQEAVFNNAAQIWNHTFYWNSLSPEGGGKPSGRLANEIEINFGSYENFIKEFAKEGVSQFGSGWVWLVREAGLLKIVKTTNAENPLSQRRGTALLALDVWEHAYYPDYQNRRNDYLTTLLEKLMNWNFAAENFGKA